MRTSLNRPFDFTGAFASVEHWPSAVQSVIFVWSTARVTTTVCTLLVPAVRVSPLVTG